MSHYLKPLLFMQTEGPLTVGYILKGICMLKLFLYWGVGEGVIRYWKEKADKKLLTFVAGHRSSSGLNTPSTQ